MPTSYDRSLAGDYGANPREAEYLLSKISADQWMIDVLADLQEAARERALHTSAEKLAQVGRVLQNEITRKRIDRMRSAFQSGEEAARMPSMRRH
ncbi:hypothetical protein [Pseudooceanicola sp. 200-1SW]|uniref:hypothetical protein n=1 Tax=Pseudooceanicola sp. 200-1SW TaxID=3425949 RepID=UPI003D7F8DF4